MRHARWGLFVMLVLVLGCNTQRPPSEATAEAPAMDVSAVKEAIDAVRASEQTAFVSGDVDALATLFTSDCQILPPMEPAVVGRDAGRAWLENLSSQFEVRAEYTSTEIEVHDGFAVERYTAVMGMTPKAGGEGMEVNAKGIHIYEQQEDGSWQIAYDVWNFDSAPGADH